MYDKSIKEFESIIIIAPRNVTGYNSRGYTFLVCSDYNKALKDFNRCAKLDPNNVTVLLNRGKTLIHLDRIKDALVNYNRLIRIAPKDGRGWNGRGVCLKKLGYNEKAIDCFSRALELTPQYQREPLINRGFTMWSHDMYFPAILDFSELIKRYGPNYEERRRRGRNHGNLFMAMRQRALDDLKARLFTQKRGTGINAKEVFWKGK